MTHFSSFQISPLVRYLHAVQVKDQLLWGALQEQKRLEEAIEAERNVSRDMATEVNQICVTSVYDYYYCYYYCYYYYCYFSARMNAIREYFMRLYTLSSPTHPRLLNG